MIFLLRHCLLTALLLLTWEMPVLAQEKKSAEVIIIGTVHNGNRYINYNTLYDVLKGIKPDVIFWEYSSAFRPVKKLLAYAALGGNVWEEQVAIQKYLKRNPATLVFPYDTTFDRRTYLSERPGIEKAIQDSLTAAYSSGRMSPEDKADLDRYRQLRQYMYQEITATPLVRMNQPDVLDSNRLLHRFDRELHLRLIKSYANAPDLINWQAVENRFWEDRNDFMAKRILAHIANHPGKRLVVLTGLMHKYYLTDLLKPHTSASQFRLSEYYQTGAAQ